MKTFRLIGMALLAVVMCVNFTSCSNDDEEESNGGKSTQELLQGVCMIDSIVPSIRAVNSNGLVL